jgi:hypothetical protein
MARRTRTRLSGDDRERIWRTYGGICGLCGGEVEFLEMHLDHIQPLYLGGPDATSNMRPTHPSCNAGRRYWPMLPDPEPEATAEEIHTAAVEMGKLGAAARLAKLGPERVREIADAGLEAARIARAAMSAEERSAIARRAVQARWDRYRAKQAKRAQATRPDPAED